MTEFDTYKWEEYLDLAEEERLCNWILDTQDIIWERAEGTPNSIYDSYHALAGSPAAAVTVARLPESRTEVTQKQPIIMPEESKFYLEFFNINFEDNQEVMEFMVAHNLDHVGRWMLDTVSKSRIFTVSCLRDYYNDFRETFLYFGLKKDVLSAELLSKEIGKSLEHDAESRKLVHRLFDKLHSGEIGMTPEFRAKVAAAGGLKAKWEKDALSHLDEINKHLRRCFITLDYRKSETTGEYVYIREETAEDLVAYAYHQLVEVMTSEQRQKVRFEQCPGCGDAFETTRDDKKYCHKNCKKRVEARKQWLKIQSDPEKMEQHRQKSRTSMKKYRDSL